MERGERMPGVTRRASRFKGGGHTDALWAAGREVAHCHDGNVDVRLTREVVRELRDELRADARIDLRGPGFDWILVRVRHARDIGRALELLRRAIAVSAASPRPRAPSDRRTPTRVRATTSRRATVRSAR